MKVFLLKNENNKDTYKSTLSPTYDPTFIPLITHTLHVEKLSNYLSSFSHDIILITSQRSVECLEKALQLISQDIRTKVMNTPTYTVGPATSRYLVSLGFSDVRGGKTGNGNELSKLMIDEIGDEKIIYFTGEIRKDIIPNALTKAGKNWEETATYETITNDEDSEIFKQNLELLSNGSATDWVVFFSSQGVEPLLSKVQHFKKAVIGPTTNSWLQERDIKVDIVCNKPSDESLFNQLKEFDQC
ncbi:uroporphyrinogen-III synthase [[Candida] jaroonii]|uniref:Uroporphyrinogen-III synthase n=1 Tax=[Candida] jaroonii TaxID=467808 RepID=A0ACA9Y5N6_9ASCO|nr:uroporphyrinogen-III synthase [[Candida] jaroonii]